MSKTTNKYAPEVRERAVHRRHSYLGGISPLTFEAKVA